MIRQLQTSTGAVETDPFAEPPPEEPCVMQDGCPECVLNVETPSSTYPNGDATLANYVCVDCGHAWTTEWRN